VNDETEHRLVRFYFSFRSPYAWIAAERLEAELGDLGVPIERIPIFPTPELFPNDPSAMPDKVAYLLQDIPRLAREYGLTVRFPSSSDTDWALPHAAFLGAESEGAGQRFMVEVFRKRFREGLDVGEDEVVAGAARRAGLNPDPILAAGHSEVLRAEVAEGWRRAAERDRIFGVPSFVHAGKLYWGQDRMHFLRSAIIRKRQRLEE
jgi:2-hydroxychromene-2-carboxylate isomerase